VQNNHKFLINKNYTPCNTTHVEKSLSLWGETVAGIYTEKERMCEIENGSYFFYQSKELI